MNGMRSWWKINGNWPKDDCDQGDDRQDARLQTGRELGDTITLNKTIAVSADDNRTEQKTGNLTGITIPATTTTAPFICRPSPAKRTRQSAEFHRQNRGQGAHHARQRPARKASKNPTALTQDEWETWYCTAYPSSIAYQIEEVIPGAVAKQVRQVAALQGNVLKRRRP